MAPRKKTTEESQNLPEVKPVKVPVEKEPKKAAPKKPAVKETTVVELAAKEPQPEKAKPQQPKAEKQPIEPSSYDRGALILGAGMLFMGILLLAGRLLHIPFGDYLWPFIFIIPGILAFLVALSTESSSGEGLSILGGILTMLGLIFLAQSITDLWASWVYAWALVAPTSIGISQMVYGMRKNRDAIVQSGRKLANLGMFMFAVGFVFFELIIGVSGYGLSRFGLPVFPMVLIFAGLFILLRSLARRN